MLSVLSDWWQKADTVTSAQTQWRQKPCQKCYCLSLNVCVCTCVCSETQLESQPNTVCFLFLAGAKPFASDNVTASWDLCRLRLRNHSSSLCILMEKMTLISLCMFRWLSLSFCFCFGAVLQFYLDGVKTEFGWDWVKNKTIRALVVATRGLKPNRYS